MRLASVFLVASGLLAGCAAPSAPPGQLDSLLADRLFAPPSEPVRTDDLFAMSDAMRHYLAVDVADQLRRDGPQAGLMEALQTRAQLKLEYDAARTKKAAATFDARTGNCLSLVIMTAAFAKELRLPLSYRSAYLEDSWSRTGNLLISSGHVNITVGRRIIDSRTRRDLSPITVDFLPPEEISGLRTREVDESTIVAMYANNRAAEALADDQLDDAYAWAAESLRRDPSFGVAYNTLGVIYLRHGNFAEAARTFERALAGEPKDTRALANLAETYGRQGRTAEAQATRLRLAALEPYPPFHFFNLGMEAMSHEDYRAAREMFAREVARADSYHEFHFWLGVADWRLGDEAAAQRHLSLAIDNSLTRSQHDLYASKL
ncbi:MAG TPA: tetratricopeptide repeat protein, partial [Caldimonas sp.]